MTIAESTLIEILFIAFAAGMLIAQFRTLERTINDHEKRIRDVEKKK
jgi:hypothetical protein